MKRPIKVSSGTSFLLRSWFDTTKKKEIIPGKPFSLKPIFRAGFIGYLELAPTFHTPLCMLLLRKKPLKKGEGERRLKAIA